MLRSIELENFKAFGKRVTIPLAPITLIFGPNSSGKSSILQSLYLLKQTWNSVHSNECLNFKSPNGFIDFGGFKDIIHKHKISNGLTFSFEFDLMEYHNDYLDSDENERLVEDVYPWLTKLGVKRISVELTFRVSAMTHKPYISNYSIYLLDRAEPFIQITRDENEISRLLISKNKIYWEPVYQFFYEKYLEYLDKRNELDDSFLDYTSVNTPIHNYVYKEMEKEWGFLFTKYDLNLFLKHIDDFFNTQNKKASYHKFIPNYLSIFSADSIYPDLFASTEEGLYSRRHKDTFHVLSIIKFASIGLINVFDDLSPIGPFRTPLIRINTSSESIPWSVGFKGEMLQEMIFNRKGKLKEINQWMKKLDLNYEIKIKSFKEQIEYFSVMLEEKFHNNSVEVNICDTGYGISQVIPIIVQSIISEGAIITIEQPELHIHPRLQAQLGDLLTHAIRMDKERIIPNQFIIETHSEHLILRLQKLIRHKKLQLTDVSIIYVDKGPRGSLVKQLRMDERGDFIDNWPGGFFDERLNEIL